jgi:hypothetical protein
MKVHITGINGTASIYSVVRTTKREEREIAILA